jgi:methylglutaconyl-CoA hydratase
MRLDRYVVTSCGKVKEASVAIGQDAGPLRAESTNGVLTLTIDAPDTRNALGSDVLGRLVSEIAAGEEDAKVRVIVVTGAGNMFSAGANLREAQSGPTPEDLYRELFEEIAAAATPVVARVNGYAYGGALGLIAACDLAVTVDDAAFSFTEARLGMAPTLAAITCVPKLRSADALELMLTCARFDGTRAAEVGLVNWSVPRKELDARMALLLDDLLAGSPQGLAICKALARRLPMMARDEAYRWTISLSAGFSESAEAKEGMAAFFEKRAPSWVPTSVPS